MGFLDTLVEDTVLRILSFSDIPSLLSVSQTCQHLHTLAFSKSIWVKCLTDINSRLRLDIINNQPLDTMSVLALVNLAKMSVVGPQTWPPAITEIPVTSHQIIIDTNERHISDQVPAKIVPGGRHLLILIDGCLECRRATDGLCIWLYNPSTNTSEVRAIITFDADLEKEGQGINIIIGILAQPSRIELIHLEPSTGVSTILFTLCTPPELIITDKLSKIRGNMAMMCGTYDSSITLINLETRSALLVFLTSMPTDIDMIPGNFFALCMNPNGNDCDIAVWNNEFLKPHWPFNGGTRSKPATIERLDPTISPTNFMTIHSSNSHVYPGRLAIHEHPLYPGCYTLWVALRQSQAYSVSSSNLFPAQACKCRILLHQVSQQCIIHPVRSRKILIPHFNDIGSAGISFAGHTTSDWHSIFVGTNMPHIPQRGHLVSLESSEGHGNTSIQESFKNFKHLILYVSPYSGALWYLDKEKSVITVEYYK